MPSIRDYIIENWDSIIIFVSILALVIFLTDRAWCIQLCLNRYCGIPSESQVRECYRECSMPESLANPAFPIVMIYVFIISIITLVIAIIRRKVHGDLLNQFINEIIIDGG